MDAALSIVLRLASVLALVILNGFFVSAEFGIVSARRTRLEQLAAGGNSAASCRWGFAVEFSTTL